MSVSSAEIVLAALERGDEASVRRGLSSMLDAGDMPTIKEAVRRAAVAGRDSSSLLEGTLEEEAQQVVHGGFLSALFCIPAILDPRASPALSSEAVTLMLDGMASRNEMFLVADGWVHPADIHGLALPKLRALTRSLGKASRDRREDRLVALPPCDFPRHPACPDDMSGGIAALGRGPGSQSFGVAARFVVGVVSRPLSSQEDPGGLFDLLVASGLSDDAMEALSTCLDAAAGAGVSVMRPGRPLEVAAATEAALETVALEARFRCVQAEIGTKPMAHYSVGERSVRVVMTRDGREALDEVELIAQGLDHRAVVDAIFAHSRAVVPHDDPDSLPSSPVRSYH